MHVSLCNVPYNHYYWPSFEGLSWVGLKSTINIICADVEIIITKY